jgi:sugar/nucleoside kinase (ribokinase family)
MIPSSLESVLVGAQAESVSLSNASGILQAILSVCLSFLLQVANDGPGKQILDELQGDGIDTSNVVVRLLL